MPTARFWFNLICGTTAAIGAVASLLFALRYFGTQDVARRKELGQLIIGFWVLIPPIFFWVDWVFFCRGLSAQALDGAKHTHELSRNIWLALIVALIAAFEIKWPTGT
jgi:hypothetical protein